MRTAFPCQQWLRERASLLHYSILPLLFHCARCHRISLEVQITVIRRLSRYLPFSEQLP